MSLWCSRGFAHTISHCQCLSATHNMSGRSSRRICVTAPVPITVDTGWTVIERNRKAGTKQKGKVKEKLLLFTGQIARRTQNNNKKNNINNRKNFLYCWFPMSESSCQCYYRLSVSCQDTLTCNQEEPGIKLLTLGLTCILYLWQREMTNSQSTSWHSTVYGWNCLICDLFTQCNVKSKSCPFEFNRQHLFSDQTFLYSLLSHKRKKKQEEK